MTKNKSESEIHRNIKFELANEIEEDVDEVIIDGEGRKTEEILSPAGEYRRPDIDGKKDGKIIVRGEAKTEKDINSKKSKDQYQAFVKNSVLVVGVRSGLKKKALSVLNEVLESEEFERTIVLEFK